MIEISKVIIIFCETTLNQFNSRTLTTVANGRLYNNEVHSMTLLNHSMNHPNKAGLTLGANVDVANDTWEESLDVFQGEMTEINLWSSVLHVEDMIKITGPSMVNAATLEIPDLFNWNEAIKDLNVTEAKFVTKKADSRLNLMHHQKGQNFVHDMHPVGMTFEEAITFCQGKGGQMFLPENNQELEAVVQHVELTNPHVFRKECEGAFWIRLYQFENDNQFRDYLNKDGQVLFQPWARGQPNGKHFQRCTALWNSGIKINQLFKKIEIIYSFNILRSVNL